MAVPCAFMRASTANSRSISRFSSAAVGSSSTKMRQRRRSALAMATSWRSANESRATGRSRSGSKSSCASTARASARMRGRSTIANGPKPRTGGSPSVMFSATDNAGTSRSSCGMVTMPAAIASCGEAKWHGLPSTSDRAAVGTIHAAQDADERRFAGAVLADDGMDFAERDVEVDIVERDRRAEPLADVFNAGGGMGHDGTVSRRSLPGLTRQWMRVIRKMMDARGRRPLMTIEFVAARPSNITAARTRPASCRRRTCRAR